ncbi:LuxE/PaaK family acyltransferase [Flavihumibacter petaseus]|uniref:Acyl-protein synthetase LuxE domain-containing protein n=1 Tax=Flavihumibacter petaseus NBRC 106054 TaxID=1220578 RepID=A0A0E9N0X7_9BACT|nr:acyltransferase [Flavihumibacter petaseus]GAO43413.1 hypothetical protein FPE01S_02_05180 [Flavihumibacter petaseus NBRC 106054]
MRSELIHKIFHAPAGDRNELMLEVYRYQYAENSLYRHFCDALKRSPDNVSEIDRIPYLPIAFFKSHTVQTGKFEPETWFESSGTTGTVNSRHLIKDLSLYRDSFLRGFEIFYGQPQEWCIIGLLPAYLERSHSSLVVMVDELIRRSSHPGSGFYLYEQNKLAAQLEQLEAAGQKTLLFGVTFALLDFAESHPMRLQHTTLIETGGMKGRGKELTRPELHAVLGEAFRHPSIHSEYGMTELLSQAYATRNGIFMTPPWMRISLREEDDPLKIIPLGNEPKQGVINVADLANLDSCAFIATDDMGRLHPSGGFEVLGRLDNSDIRGCSLMAL